MRTLAIGDIHGCATALDALLAVVEPSATDVIVTLGDYVDRGPDSAGVLDRLIALSRAHTVVPILGNHEQVLIESPHDPAVLADWRGFGGRETMESYGMVPSAPEFGHVPEAHWEFLRTCRDFYETDTHIFVHGNASPDLPLDQQPWQELRWRAFTDFGPHRSGKVIVCGHTAQASGVPLNLGHLVCIDTAAYAGGWLTCLDTATGHYAQSNEHGKTRLGTLDPTPAPMPASPTQSRRTAPR